MTTSTKHLPNTVNSVFKEKKKGNLVNSGLKHTKTNLFKSPSKETLRRNRVALKNKKWRKNLVTVQNQILQANKTGIKSCSTKDEFYEKLKVVEPALQIRKISQGKGFGVIVCGVSHLPQNTVIGVSGNFYNRNGFQYQSDAQFHTTKVGPIFVGLKGKFCLSGASINRSNNPKETNSQLCIHPQWKIPYVKLIRNVNKGEEILFSYGQSYTMNPNDRKVKSEINEPLLLTNGQYPSFGVFDVKGT